MTDFFPTDRSRQISYERCPRKRFIEYHWEDKGIVPDKVAVPLATGGSIHLGLQRLLEGASVDEAVQDALRNYREAVADAGFQDTHDANQDYTIKEQFALTEVMLRAWALKRLPLFQQNYRVIEIEHEAPPVQLAPGIWMFRRPDGVLENVTTGFYEILSFKTAKQYGYKNDKSNIVDVQGISETWAVAQKYGEEKVGPVLMEFLVTGPRKLATFADEPAVDAFDSDEDDDLVVGSSSAAPLKYQWNPFIRAWRDNYGNVSWRFKMPGPDGEGMPTMAKFFNPAYGKKLKAGPGEYKKYEVKSFAVWEEMPVKEWFERMTTHILEPERCRVGITKGCGVFPHWLDPFDKMFVARKYNRMPFELSEWQEQAGLQEQRIKDALYYLSNPEPQFVSLKEKRKIMAQTFPKYRHSCQYPTPCPFQRICWEGLSDPLSAGFKYRRPNHPEKVDV